MAVLLLGLMLGLLAFYLETQDKCPLNALYKCACLPSSRASSSVPQRLFFFRYDRDGDELVNRDEVRGGPLDKQSR